MHLRDIVICVIPNITNKKVALISPYGEIRAIFLLNGLHTDVRADAALLG